jgi:hypothetical protein
MSTSGTFSGANCKRMASSFLSKHGMSVQWNTREDGTPRARARMVLTMTPCTCCGERTLER